MKNRIAAAMVLFGVMQLALPLVVRHEAGTSFSGPTIPPGPWDDDDSGGDTKFC